MCVTEGLKALSVEFHVARLGLGRESVYRCVTYTDESQNDETLNTLYYVGKNLRKWNLGYVT